MPIIYADRIYEYFSISGFLPVLARAQNSAFDFVGAFLTSIWLPVVLFVVFLLAYSFSNLFRLKKTVLQVVGMIF